MNIGLYHNTTNYVPPSPLAPPMITQKGESKHKIITTKYKCLQIKGTTNK
jgi:hypothetical protein